MKAFLSLIVAVALAVIPSLQVHARDPVTLDFFYDNLEPYGSWREVGNYGYCWQPRDVDQDWRPYSDGRWVYTDAGWTWDSDEPYGWAVYHYGRWANIDLAGWVWIPGTEWGPGWVSWRHSPRYVGWAPLPPEAIFLRALGLSAWVDDYYDIGPSHYSFVEGSDFGSRSLRSVFIDRSQNFNIIHQTTNITNITYQGDIVHNGGLRFDQQSRESREPLHRYKLDRRQDFRGDPRRLEGDQMRSRVSGDSLSVLALPFVSRSSHGPSNRSEKLGKIDVNRGWRGAGSAEEINALRDKMKSKTRLPNDLPPRPRFDRPSDGDSKRPGDRPPSKGDDKPGDRDRGSAVKPLPPMKGPEQPDRPPSKGDDKPDDRDRRPGVKPTPPIKRPDQPDRPPSKDDDKPGDRDRRPGGVSPLPPSKRPEQPDRPTPPKASDQPKPPKGPSAKGPVPEVKKPTPDPQRPRPQTKPQPPSKRPEGRKPEPPQKRKSSPAKPKEQRPDIKRPGNQPPQSSKPDKPRPQAQRPESKPKPEAKRPEAKRPAPASPPPATAKPSQPSKAKDKGKTDDNDKKNKSAN